MLLTVREYLRQSVVYGAKWSGLPTIQMNIGVRVELRRGECCGSRTLVVFFAIDFVPFVVEKGWIAVND